MCEWIDKLKEDVLELTDRLIDYAVQLAPGRR